MEQANLFVYVGVALNSQTASHRVRLKLIRYGQFFFSLSYESNIVMDAATSCPLGNTASKWAPHQLRPSNLNVHLTPWRLQRHIEQV